MYPGESRIRDRRKCYFVHSLMPRHRGCGRDRVGLRLTRLERAEWRLLTHPRPKTSHGSNGMTSKVQGEGDYESARRYDEETKRFVEEKTKEGKPLEGSASEASDELTPEEKKARARAKAADEDQRDADALRKAEEQRKH